MAAPPEKGKANLALAAHLAKLLGLNRREVSVVAGHGHPLKTLRIDGVTADAVRAALSPDRS